jgi:hypothetical protein
LGKSHRAKSRKDIKGGGGMANEQNLIPFDERSKSEARELGAKGGKASGEARRLKKTCRDFFMQLREMPVNDEKLIAAMKRAGFTNNDDLTYGAAMAMQTMIKAMKGNSQMMRLAYEMMGENQTQGVVVNSAPPEINVNFVKADKDER